jgi:hypothetical protein
MSRKKQSFFLKTGCCVLEEFQTEAEPTGDCAVVAEPTHDGETVPDRTARVKAVFPFAEPSHLQSPARSRRQWCPSKNLPSPGGRNRFRGMAFFSVRAENVAAPRVLMA